MCITVNTNNRNPVNVWITYSLLLGYQFILCFNALHNKFTGFLGVVVFLV